MLQPCRICGEDNLLRMDIHDNNKEDSRQASITCLKCGYTIEGVKMPSMCFLAEVKVSAIVAWNTTPSKNKGVTPMPYKPKLNPEITAREIIDFETKGNVIRFYLGKNGEQRGDDWDDRPYECNAGTVYDEFVGDIVDLFVSFDCAVLQPSDGWNTNSRYCKEDMRDRNVPCIIIVPPEVNDSYYVNDFAHWVGSDNVIKIYFGDTLDVDGLTKKIGKKGLRLVTK